VRQAVLDEIELRGMTREELARALDLMETGAFMLMSMDYWPLQQGLRVAEAIGVPIALRVGIDRIWANNARV